MLPGEFYEARVARRDYSYEEKVRRAELRRQAGEARRQAPAGTASAAAGGTGEAPCWPPTMEAVEEAALETLRTAAPLADGGREAAVDDGALGLLPESALEGAGGPVQARSRAGSAESSGDWIARGVVVPRLEDVQRVAMRERWPLRVNEEDGWVIAIIPCYEDLADEMQRVLESWGATAPPPPEEHRPAPAAVPESLPDSDAAGVTWLAGPSSSAQAHGSAPAFLGADRDGGGPGSAWRGPSGP